MIGQTALETGRVVRRVLSPRFRRYVRRFARVCLVLAVLLGGVAFWIHSDPAAIPEAVDVARAIVGPQAVAQVEAWAFETQDAIRQEQYRTGHAQPTVQWAAPVATLAPVVRASKANTANVEPKAATSAAPMPVVHAPPASSLDWTPYLATSSGQSVMDRALVSPDPDRPYVQAALVRIDLAQSQLHLVAGTQEPLSNVKASRPGKIPADDYANLVAAFNGGFKAANGAFGMGIGMTTLLQPQNGLATLAIYNDGSVRLGVWGVDMQATPEMAAFRQNCPLLLDHGVPTAQAQSDDPTLWGKTVGNKIATWRSGLGVSADGRYLFYVAGDGLTVPTLAQALAQAGADRGMQLDINSFWTRFVTYAPGTNNHAPTAQKLTDGMQGDAHQFIAADNRDFFYLTMR